MIEKDFKVEHNGTSFVLYHLKTKKELKEDAQDSYKFMGFYKNIENVLWNIYLWRKTKKYPFKESPEQIHALLTKYLIVKSDLSKHLMQPRFELVKIRDYIYERAENLVH